MSAGHRPFRGAGLDGEEGMGRGVGGVGWGRGGRRREEAGRLPLLRFEGYLFVSVAITRGNSILTVPAVLFAGKADQGMSGSGWEVLFSGVYAGRVAAVVWGLPHPEAL